MKKVFDFSNVINFELAKSYLSTYFLFNKVINVGHYKRKSIHDLNEYEFVKDFTISEQDLDVNKDGIFIKSDNNFIMNFGFKIFSLNGNWETKIDKIFINRLSF